MLLLHTTTTSAVDVGAVTLNSGGHWTKKLHKWRWFLVWIRGWEDDITMQQKEVAEAVAVHGGAAIELAKEVVLSQGGANLILAYAMALAKTT